jgi:hypothetical protein
LPNKAVGHLVYDHPLTRSITPEKGLNHQWWRLFDGSVTFVLNDMPTQPDVLIRSVEGPFSLKSKALLFEAKVGKGRLIASGLNHLNNADRPEMQWVMDQIVKYTVSDAQPQAEISIDWLEQRMADVAQDSQTANLNAK